MLRTVTAIIALVLAIVVVPLVLWKGADPTRRYPVPEDGKISRGIYRNDYFGFVYPLPAGWVEDLKGPAPSPSGYYSLVALKPRDSLAATLLIAAQDNFFLKRKIAGATDFLEQMQKQLVPALSGESPVKVEIAGQSFGRLDYAGAGLRHVVLVTEIRCHTVVFAATSASPEQIASVVASLNKITFTAADRRRPICVPEYATADRIVHRVEPAPAGPRFSSIPTRIIVAANGKVQQVHAIGALPEQAKSIRDALSQWEWKPYVLNGKRVAVETGLFVQFTPGP